MKCAHCIRGSAQALDMDLEIINRVISQAGTIHTLSITGGEPSLNASAISHMRFSLNYQHCRLGYFWVATNARFFKEDFYNELIWLHEQCNEPDMCVLTISGDQYHYRQSNVAYEKYQALPFYAHDKTCDISYERIINDGNAKKNGIGYKEHKPNSELFDTYIDNGELYIGDLIYVNAKGDVLLDCDLSYKNQEKHKIGNILEEKFEDIILRKLAQQRLVAA